MKNTQSLLFIALIFNHAAGAHASDVIQPVAQPAAPAILCAPTLVEASVGGFQGAVDEALRDLAAGKVLSTEQKAVIMNADTSKAGTFAEIGAGVEIVNHIYHAGKARQTILRQISEYDQDFSDDSYEAPGKGYVSEGRLEKMLEHELARIKRINIDKPSRHDPKQTRFFVIADSAGTKPHSEGGGHAWLGITYQTKPEGPFNTIKMHVRLLDNETPKQSAALGTLGINLMHAAFERDKLDLDGFALALKENLTYELHGQVEIDSMHVSGADFAHYTDTDVAITLLRTGLTPTVIIDADGNFPAASQYTYNMNLLIHETDTKLTNLVTPEQWAANSAAFIEATQAEPKRIRAVEWVPLQADQLKSKDDEGHLRSAIETMRKTPNVSVVLSRLTNTGTLTRWGQALPIQTVGIAYEKSQYPTMSEYFSNREKPAKLEVAGVEVNHSPFNLILERKAVVPAAGK